jgi:hypothetical protein
MLTEKILTESSEAKKLWNDSQESFIIVKAENIVCQRRMLTKTKLQKVINAGTLPGIAQIFSAPRVPEVDIDKLFNHYV